MAISFQLCVLFIFSFVSVKSGILTGKAFICRDPDTGKLHPVNSTWRSTTFCGNYTCKLKQKNSTSIQLETFREDNDTISNENIENNGINNKSQTVSLENNMTLKVPSVLNSERSNISENNDDTKTKDDNKKINMDVKDRYLTESEIKTISEILHTVKKSDLDAIVDVYKFAQDVYKETDEETTENPIDGIIKNKSNPDIDHKHISYWYEPLHNSNNKGKAVDMQIAGTNTVNTVKSEDDNPNSYFRGNVVGTDFRKVPYYYPISAFQRMASYVPNQQLNKENTAKVSCKNQSSETSQINVNNNKVPGYILKNPYTESQKMIQPSILLPYPFSYIHHYNISSYPYNVNFGNYPWINSGSNKKNYLKTSQKQINAPLSQQIPDTEDNLLEAFAKRQIDKKPEWQTEQLATQILDEVKANMDSKSKIIKTFPFRKKVKLDKVGKVIKLDEIKRTKRSSETSSDEHQDSEEAELFEVFLERTICKSDMQPGFFKVGNMSQPFPECCPQRIKQTN